MLKQSLKWTGFGKPAVVGLFALALVSFAPAAHASTIYSAAPVSITQTGLTVTSLGGGLNQWDTALNVTNSSANPIFGVSFVEFTTEVSDDGGASYYYPAWNNALQEWTLSSPYSATVSIANSSSQLTQGQTTVAFPAGLGGDSFPVLPVAGEILPGQTVNFNVINDISSNIDVYYFGDSAFLASPVPEPGTLSLLLLGCGVGGGLLSLRRRKLARPTCHFCT